MTMVLRFKMTIWPWLTSCSPENVVEVLNARTNDIHSSCFQRPRSVRCLGLKSFATICDLFKTFWFTVLIWLCLCTFVFDLLYFTFFQTRQSFTGWVPLYPKQEAIRSFLKKSIWESIFVFLKRKAKALNLEPGLRVWHGIVFGFTCWSGRSQLQCHLEKLSPLGNSGLLHPGFSEIFRNIHNIRNIDNIHTQTHTVDLKFSFLIISCSPSAKINSAWGKVLIARPNTFTSFNNSLKSVWFSLDKLLFFCLKKLLYFLKASGFCLKKLLYFLKASGFCLTRFVFFCLKSCCIFFKPLVFAFLPHCPRFLQEAGAPPVQDRSEWTQWKLNKLKL